MEDSIGFDVSPRKTKKSRWEPVTENDSPITNSDLVTRKVISNGTESITSEAVSEEVKPLSKEKPNTIKITKVLKSSRTEQKKELIQSLPKEVRSPIKIHTSSTSPTSSQLAEDGFHGFDNLALSEKQSKKQDAFFRFLDKCNASANSTSSQSKIVEERAVEEIVEENSNNKRDKEMTVDTDHVSDSDSGQDSEQMEMDIGNDKDSISKADSADFSSKHDKVEDGTKDSDVDIMETDSVKSGDGKLSRKNEQGDASKSAKADGKTLKSPILESTLKGSQLKVEYCGGCEGEVDDAEEGICCDGKCERWFHLRCSGLTQTEYNELSLDENAKWACNSCSGKPPPALRPLDSKPLLSVRKDLAKVSTPSPAKRKSSNKEGSVRTPKIDISNPAFLKPFDFGWKRELVYRSTNDNHNRRQGDIYYYTPKGKKLRSLREITDHLVGSELTQDNFTFWKEPLGIEDPDKEIIRDAKLKLVNKDSSASPNVVKKVVTPKITKVPKSTPKLTATVTPLDSSNVVSGTTPKASASVTPRVVLKGKTNLSTGPKFKITPSKNSTPGQAQKIVISKGTEKTASKQYPPYSNYQDVIADYRATTSSVQNKNVKDIEMNTRNKFKRYGLLANAKSPQKKVNKMCTLPSASTVRGSTNVISEIKLQSELSKMPSQSQSKIVTSPISRDKQQLEEKSKGTSFRKEEKLQNCIRKTDSAIVRPMSKANLSDTVALSSSPDDSLLISRNKLKPSAPEFQFRPSNPSSYGCQTNATIPFRSIGSTISSTSSSLYRTNMVNCTSPFETVFIVDSSTETFTNSTQKDITYESPLILNNSDCSIEIISVESLNSKDKVNKYDGSYHVPSSSNQTSLNSSMKSSTISMNDCRRHDLDYRKERDYSPVSVESSSTEEIVVVDEDQNYSSSPPCLIRNSPLPKTSRHISPPHRSPPNLQPMFPSTSKVPSSKTYTRQFSPSKKTSKKNLNSSQNSNQTHEETMKIIKRGSPNMDYRKLKKERFYMRQKAVKEMEELKKSLAREKEVFLKRRSEERRLRIRYLQLKVKMKELKMSLLKKKLEKL